MKPIKTKFLSIINKFQILNPIHSWQKWIPLTVAIILAAVFYFNSNFNYTSSTENDSSIQNIPEQTESLSEQTTEQQDFTIETLISLCQDNNLSQLINQQGLDGFLIYKNIKPVEVKSSLTWLYACSLSYLDREYELQICYWLPENALSYGHIGYEIDSVTILELETKDRQLLYSSEPRFKANTDILSFLEKQYCMEQYMTLSIPENYHLGRYEASGFLADDWQIITDETETYKEIPHGDATPEPWYASGGIGIFNHTELLHFENGNLTSFSYLGNHSWISSEPEPVNGCEVPSLLVEFSFDLFTLPQWEDYKLQYGETTSPQSHFWYIFLAKENNPTAYVVFLNQTYFTKEDAIRLAQSIQFTEKAF